jgi:hypothetical protein
MPFPIKKCAVCGEEFELKPDKPGFANRCPECSAEEESASSQGLKETATKEQNAERRKAIRDLLYHKDS